MKTGKQLFKTIISAVFYTLCLTIIIVLPKDNPTIAANTGTIEYTDPDQNILLQQYLQSDLLEIETIQNALEHTESAYIVINDNQPFFSTEYLPDQSGLYLSDLDTYGRTGQAIAVIGPETLPAATAERESISGITPSGFENREYETVKGNWLYHRCHLIGYQLSGNNDSRNIMTGTRDFNIEGMLPFENMLADNIKETDNHILHRVTPIYQNTTDALAIGVLMEAYSIEDTGASICFNVFCINQQPGIEIDYATGNSYQA